MSSRKQNCKGCGREIYYDGLCWTCKAEADRAECLSLTKQQVQDKVDEIIAKIIDEEFLRDEFRKLFCYRGISIEKIAQAALKNEIFYPAEIYWRAPDEIRDPMLERLLATEDSREASQLMICLAMQEGPEKAEVLKVFQELEKNPRSWRKKLYVDSSRYAECAGWTFDDEGKRQELNFSTCYPMVKGDEPEKSPVRIGKKRDEKCPHCECSLVDILSIDGRDRRLAFLGVDGIMTMTLCPNCLTMAGEPFYCRYTLDGKSEMMDHESGDEECYIDEATLTALTHNNLVLADQPVFPFFGCYGEDIHTIGGQANWVQDWEYLNCPCCNKKMHYLAQVQWGALADAEGTFYFEICRDCQIIGAFHQQT